MIYLIYIIIFFLLKIDNLFIYLGNYVVIKMSNDTRNKKEEFTKCRDIKETDRDKESSSNDSSSSDEYSSSDDKSSSDEENEEIKITKKMQNLDISNDRLKNVKIFGRKWVNDVILQNKITQTKPGSIKYLLFGPEPSRQSISIKFGKLGEKLVIEMIKYNSCFELLKCGVHCINEQGNKKDLDLLWADHKNKIIYYREAKGNIELDSEKLPATFEKITRDLKPYIKKEYPYYKINVGILNWSVYSRSSLKKGVSHINQCERNGVQVDHMGDLMEKIGFKWEEKDYYSYFRELGNLINTMFE